MRSQHIQPLPPNTPGKGRTLEDDLVGEWLTTSPRTSCGTQGPASHRTRVSRC